jgi:dipeptide/tripeptide permease
LDNGYTVTGSLLLTESAGLSSSYTSMTMGSLGTIIVGSGYFDSKVIQFIQTQPRNLAE